MSTSGYSSIQRVVWHDLQLDDAITVHATVFVRAFSTAGMVTAGLAQSVERQALNLMVEGSSPSFGVSFSRRSTFSLGRFYRPKAFPTSSVQSEAGRHYHCHYNLNEFMLIFNNFFYYRYISGTAVTSPQHSIATDNMHINDVYIARHPTLHSNNSTNRLFKWRVAVWMNMDNTHVHDNTYEYSQFI